MKFDFHTDSTFDTFFEQLFEKLRKKYGATSMNALAECSKLYSGHFSSHFRVGLELSKYKTPTIEEFDSLKQKYSYFRIHFRAMNSHKVRFFIFHNGIEFVPNKYEKRKLRRLVERTIRAKIRSLRDMIVRSSYQHERLEEFFHVAIRDHLPTVFKYEKASIFYIEAGYTNLVLGATTGIRHRTSSAEISRTDVVYEEGSHSQTYKAYQTGEPFFENKPLRNCRFIEDVSVIENRLYIPLKMRPAWAGNTEEVKDSLVGVLRLCNFKRNGDYQYYSDVDYLILCYFAEFMSVLCNQYINVMLLTREHDRATHGYNTDLSALSMLADTHQRKLDKLFNQLRITLNTIQVRSSEDERTILNLQNHFGALETQSERAIRNLKATQDSMAAQFLTAMLYSENSAGFVSKTSNPVTTKPMVQAIHRIRAVFDHMKDTHNANGVRLLYASRDEFNESFTNIPAVKMPPGHLYLILRNLVENSVKYSKRYTRNGIVDLRWRASGERVKFSVIDNGIGIPEAEVSKVFKTGYRADNALNRTTSGMGLGLSNCRHIAGIFDGDLYYEGKGYNDEGATFCLVVRRA